MYSVKVAEVQAIRPGIVQILIFTGLQFELIQPVCVHGNLRAVLPWYFSADETTYGSDNLIMTNVIYEEEAT